MIPKCLMGLCGFLLVAGFSFPAQGQVINHWEFNEPNDTPLTGTVDSVGTSSWLYDLGQNTTTGDQTSTVQNGSFLVRRPGAGHNINSYAPVAAAGLASDKLYAVADVTWDYGLATATGQDLRVGFHNATADANVTTPNPALANPPPPVTILVEIVLRRNAAGLVQIGAWGTDEDGNIIVSPTATPATAPYTTVGGDVQSTPVRLVLELDQVNRRGAVHFSLDGVDYTTVGGLGHTFAINNTWNPNQVRLGALNNFQSGGSEGLRIHDLVVTLDSPVPPPPIVITSHPANQIVDAGDPASFSVTAFSNHPTNPTLTYQWQKNGLDISDGPGVSGATTPDLALSNAQFADSGSSFQVVITDVDNETATSNAATLTVLALDCNSPFADADGDGDVDMDDFAIWQRCYTGPTGAGFDFGRCGCFDRQGTGRIDGDDLLEFIACADASGPAVPADPHCGGTGILFADDFNVNSSADWTILTHNETAVTFSYDYSADGIPPAPNGTGTRGLKFEANIGQGSVSAVTALPKDLYVIGNYTVKFDMWINANGPFPGGGVGSTEYITAGIGHDGTTVNGGTQTAPTGSGGWFAVNGEGGSGNQDFRAFKNNGVQFAESGQFAAGTSSAGAVSPTNAHNRENPYYHTAFPGGQEAPALQQTNHPGPDPGDNQTGALHPGTVGFAWREVEVKVVGKTAQWSIDGLVIATLNATVGAAFPLAGNVFVGYWDSFPSLSDNPDVSFGLIDNLVVIQD